ncbi:uncharacterized protein LOC133892231 [Phragmites australis]|uniref:uncharacterized protein LOC133892231 n=1 Tax=Phragmites australis TaxID=29695 RepID=UPI002D783E13|nr:uncharacterized protein LOC133892231 [Phragmites australis]
MERTVASVRIRVPRGIRLELPRCTRAEALALRPTHFVHLELPDPAAVFRRLAELSLAMVLLPAGTLPFHEFLSSCCPRLRRLRLCCVRGDAMRRLVLHSDALEVLDLNNLDDLERVDVVAANLRSLSVRSCFRFPLPSGREGDDDNGETEMVFSAPRMEAVLWYRSYPKRLSFLTDMANVRRLSGLKLPALGRRDQFDFLYTVHLLQACSVAEHLSLDPEMPDEMSLLNWLGPDQVNNDLVSRLSTIEQKRTTTPKKQEAQRMLTLEGAPAKDGVDASRRPDRRLSQHPLSSSDSSESESPYHSLSLFRESGRADVRKVAPTTIPPKRY